MIQIYRLPNMSTVMERLSGICFAILTIYFSVLSFGLAEAQSGVSGTVTDVKGLPLPTATVLLLNPADSSLFKGAITEEDGSYHFQNIPTATYILSVSMVGFKKHYSDQFEVENRQACSQRTAKYNFFGQLGAGGTRKISGGTDQPAEQ